MKIAKYRLMTKEEMEEHSKKTGIPTPDQQMQRGEFHTDCSDPKFWTIKETFECDECYKRICSGYLQQLCDKHI